MTTATAQTFRARCVPWVLASTSLLTILLTVGCGSSTTTPGGTDQKTATISGKVQSTDASQVKALSRSAKLLDKRQRPQSRNLCASTSCSTIVVGSGGSGTAGPACSVDASGNFTINSVPVGQQLEATFGCGTTGSQSCIVMSGDTGVTCDPVADAVIKAFLSEMNITSLGDATLAHANIAQIAHSIEQAAQTGTSAANAFLTAVTNCSTSACYLDAIKASPFFGPFRLMQTMVNGWDVESIFTLLTDVMGYQIEVDPFTYTSFGTNLDIWLGTDFVAKTRTFVSAMLADQAAGGNTYVTEIVCQMNYNKYQSGGTINYAPSSITVGSISNVPSCTEPNPTAASALEKNGLTSTQINLINNAINNGTNGQIDISVGSVGCSAGSTNTATFCINVPQMIVKTKASEPNRNDPLGTNNNNFIQSTNLSMINVFSAVNTALLNAVTNAPNDTTTGPNLGQPCASGGTNGPPNVINDNYCNNWFGTLFTPSVKQAFAGVIGLYMALKNNSLGSNSLLSLNDLYAMFGNASFLGMKLTDQSNFTWGVQYNQTQGGTAYLTALLNDANTAGSSNNFTLDPTFLNSNPSSAISAQAATNLFTAATFNFNDSFQIFENIPTASTIHDYVFKSAYHVDYNPTGNSTYYAAGGKVIPTGNTGGSTADPIFCKMTDVNGNAVEVDMASNPTVTVSCSDAATLGVAVDVNGNLTVPSGFTYPYTLSQWGYQGDSKGAIFVLQDWQTGFQIMPNGHQQFVYQLNGGNPGGVCAGSANPLDTNTVVSTYMTVSNGASMVSQLITAYCMDMTAFATINRIGFYNAGNLQISQNNPNCPTCTMGVGVVGGLNFNNTNTYATPAVCVFAASNSLTVSNSIATPGSGGGVVIDDSGHITNLGNMIVDYCTVSHASTTSYQLVSINGWGATADSSLYAQLLPTGTNTTPLQWEAFPTAGTSYFDPTTYYLSVDAGRLNTAFDTTYSKADNSYRVAPTSPPTQIQGISLANTSWETKFDPYCDSLEGDGKCHCLDGTTNAAKSGSQCTLEDVPVDPTMSSPPYFVNYGQAPTAAPAFFADYGGKSGSQLVDTNGAGLNWNSTSWTGSGGAQIQNVNINLQQALVCQYLATGETVYRRPTFVSQQWNQNQGGCPDSTGTVASYSCNDDCGGGPYVNHATGGGPIRVVQPVPMNNAYATLTPNAAVKMINYATKDTGQGVTIDPAQKVFTFDTALALMAFRTDYPLTGLTVTSNSTPVPGPLGVFQRINNPSSSNSNNNQLDPVSSVLCYLTNSGNACTTSNEMPLFKSTSRHVPLVSSAKLHRR